MTNDGIVRCDSPLYAVNMFYYHWLMNKAVSANDLAEQSQTENSSREIYIERIDGAKETLCSCYRSNMLVPVSHSLVVIYKLIEMG